MAGAGEKADRRPLDPPPIIRLRIRRPSLKNKASSSLSDDDFVSPTLTHSLFMFASLVGENDENEMYLLDGSRTKHVTGSVVSSLFHLKDQSCFVFPDLSVRTEGRWRFKMSMYEIMEDGVHFCSSIMTDTFTVYSSKRFPGMGQSTELSRAFAQQGLRLRIRRPARNDEENQEPERATSDSPKRQLATRPSHAAPHDHELTSASTPRRVSSSSSSSSSSRKRSHMDDQPSSQQHHPERRPHPSQRERDRRPSRPEEYPSWGPSIGSPRHPATFAVMHPGRYPSIGGPIRHPDAPFPQAPAIIPHTVLPRLGGVGGAFPTPPGMAYPLHHHYEPTILPQLRGSTEPSLHARDYPRRLPSVVYPEIPPLSAHVRQLSNASQASSNSSVISGSLNGDPPRSDASSLHRPSYLPTPSRSPDDQSWERRRFKAGPTSSMLSPIELARQAESSVRMEEDTEVEVKEEEHRPAGSLAKLLGDGASNVKDLPTSPDAMFVDNAETPVFGSPGELNYMPPFTLPVNAQGAAGGGSGSPQPPGSPSSPSSSQPQPTNAFQAMIRVIRGRGPSSSGGGSSGDSSSSSTSRDRETLLVPKRAIGSSSRGAGVAPKKVVQKRTVSPALAPVYFGSEVDLVSVPRREAFSGAFVAGPSRGGFIVQATKSPATVASSPSAPSSPMPSMAGLSAGGLLGSPLASPSDSPITLSSGFLKDPLPPPPPPIDKGSVLPPSKILPLLLQTSQANSDPVPLLQLLAVSVELYPFPPPPVASISLSEALSVHPLHVPPPENAPSPPPTPTSDITLPHPTPCQIYISQSHLLSSTSPPAVRSAVLDLMRACIEACLGSTGGMKESEKAVFWDEARRWADEAKSLLDTDGGKRWVLPDADREALVAILSSLTRGGRNLSDVPGLVALLCTFVTDSLPVPAPPSPLFDPAMDTPFTETVPSNPSRHASSLALLTSLHKFSASHIFSESTYLSLKTALAVARLREERDIGGNDHSVLGFISAVVRFGEVSGRRTPRLKDHLAEQSLDRLSASESDEILRDVVSVVARIVGCEGLVGVVEVSAGSKATRKEDVEEQTRPSILPGLALELMRDLLRSPANQALKTLRAILVAPPTSSSPPPTPVLLLVGTLRSLRKALLEHSQDAEANAASRSDPTSLNTGESRWPTMLSLGLPFLWENIRRVMQWKSAYVDAEVMRLVEERLEAAERLALRTRELATSPTSVTGESILRPGGGGGGGVGNGSSGGDESWETGVSYEEWDMTIEVLIVAQTHISLWEEQHKQPWIWVEGSEGQDLDNLGSATAPRQFKQRPGVLSAFSSLLEKVVAAWRSPTFSGPSERVFALLVSLAPHLGDEHAQIVIDQCDHNDLCLPSHPEWLDRIQEVVKAFYTLPNPQSISTPTSNVRRAVASSATRRRALQLLSSLHSHVRHLDSLRETFVASIVMPLLETTFETESDVDVVEVLLALLVEIARDALPLGEKADQDDGPLGTFDRIRLLLVRVARGSVRPSDRVSASIPTTPKVKRGVGLSSLSKVGSEASPSSSMRSSASISAPAPSSGNAGPQPDHKDVPFLAVLALIKIFHLCLARSTPASSENAIVLFRDLLGLLAPAALTTSDTPDVVIPLRTRLAILQWLVRFRADAAHRVHWLLEVDISAPSQILGRVGIDLDSLGDQSAVGTAENESRGRSQRPADGERRGRDPSGSRLRVRSEDRSPSRGASSGRRSAPAVATAGPALWCVPEVLPFTIDIGLVASVGGRGLASFDHNRMRNWTEEEDPGTGLMKVTEVPDTTPPEHFMVVLPVSEYLRVINHLLQHSHEWELVSYILCHLPEQLSNKHFSCGPRCAQQIHILRRHLCDGLRGGEQSFLGDIPLPPRLKRAEVHATGYLCLTSLIAYRSLFNKSQQDDLVDTFMFGLGNPRDTAKVCIHALAMASFELRPSMRKHLSVIVRHLQKIISTATLGVHILELMAGIGQEPSLYANFTEVDFQTVFGIALKYIQTHNDRLADDPGAEAAMGGVEYAFSQYVFLLAYYVIAAWYMALRLSERPKYVPFLTRRLVQANEGKAEVDEPTEVCFDMIARYAYSNADPRPRHSGFDKMITTGQASSITNPQKSKTWIVGTATVTVKNLAAAAWVEVTVRRASGVVRMLWELQNISGVTPSHEGELIAMYLRHREANGIATGAGSSVTSVVSEALASLPSPSRQPQLGHRARSNTVSGSVISTLSPLGVRTEEAVVSEAINGAAQAAAQPTLESGLLSVDPSFFTLQLSAFPDLTPTTRPLLVPNDAQSQRALGLLDRLPVVDFHKIGVLYVGPGQFTEQAILNNTHGSKAYIRFISGLGQLIRLKGSRELDIYTGGLDQEADFDGKWTYQWDDDISQIVFHVATLMPTSLQTDPRATRKKAHIGNDFVKIVWNDSGGEFAFDTLPGDFNFVNIVIQPHTPAGNPWIGPGMTNNTEFFKVSMQCRPGMPEVGPLGAFKMVTAQSLPDFVRQMCLHSNIFAQVYLASVGFTSQDSQNTKVEYSSNWRKRLQQIKRLRARVYELSGQDGPTLPDLLNVEAAEAARLFTSFL
ncbi:hypothetical protein T439DRAFT_352854 [Meredithblackwellia eburnea MCA 4105]